MNIGFYLCQIRQLKDVFVSSTLKQVLMNHLKLLDIDKVFLMCITLHGTKKLRTVPT